MFPGSPYINEGEPGAICHMRMGLQCWETLQSDRSEYGF